MTKPFEGIRILDFTQVFAGPFGTFQLALLGADVIKVERRGGENMRFSPGAKEWADRAYAPTFCAVNGNKRDIELDLKDPKAIEIVKRLAKKADIVAENFRPGVMDRLGIGYEALSEINPKLIYCGVSGFGREGPYANTPSYDGRIQATSGIMSITGHEDSVPTRAGFAVCDALTGMTAAFAMSSALHQRTLTGKGQLIDVAMLDATLTFLSPTLCEHTIAGLDQGRFGNQAISRIPTANLFACKGGHILLAVNNEGQFLKLLKCIDREDILDDPRFKDWPTRIENETTLREVIETAFADADADTWEVRLSDAGAPASRINTLADAVSHPQLEYRDVMQEIDGPYGRMKVVGSGFKLAHGSGEVTRPAPLLGEHADEVLAEAGYSDTEVAEMRETGVI
ncbi:MAG: crotonobetainyl-CoA:carnitine CoA-transferase CaiB-like acyl-CoA transferase [Hyphomicrobiaceae bacterium]|jgi:crotonobetainyl-CoA:carnitine CoA-transferase CaiB-like acyl-CoA transferase